MPSSQFNHPSTGFSMRQRYSTLTKYAKALSLVIFAVSASLSINAHAQDDEGFFFGQPAKGKWIIGAKIANVDTNIPEVQDSEAAGVVLGYEFARPVGNNGGSATIELEYLQSDKTRISIEELSQATYEADIINLFFTYRSAGKLYFKVKGGFSYVDRTVNNVAGGVLLNNNDFLISTEDVSIAGGIGLGYRINDNGVIEVEYSQDSGDADTGILGVNAFLQF
ncbi:MAG: hypothetical protein AAF197_10640 [Pseudomonadota bacterium]